MNWRRFTRVTHRDLGFLCVGLTLLYAISGVAVNHIEQWNPNYEIETREVNVGVLPPTGTAVHVLDVIGDYSPVKSTYKRDARTLEIFTQMSTVTVDLPTGVAQVEIARERDFLFPLNYLHLNHAKKLWTWVADLYAIALAVLALTGLFLVKGKRGLRGRGGVLTVIGFVVPVVFFLLYH
jgi:hypothetical protein